MSSKFGTSPVLQKTPKICKKPPEALPLLLKVFKNYDLHAYVEWKDPFSPLDGGLSGQTTLAAFPNYDLHFGAVYGKTHYVEMDLIYNPVVKLFTYTVQLLIGLVIIDTVITSWPDDQPKIPFETRLFKFEDPSSSRIVRSRILS